MDFESVFHTGEESKLITNADRIRAMSDEELAEIIMCPYGSEPDLCRTPGTCLDCCEIWLRQPADPPKEER